MRCDGSAPLRAPPSPRRAPARPRVQRRRAPRALGRPILRPPNRRRPAHHPPASRPPNPSRRAHRPRNPRRQAPGPRTPGPQWRPLPGLRILPGGLTGHGVASGRSLGRLLFGRPGVRHLGAVFRGCFGAVFRSLAGRLLRGRVFPAGEGDDPPGPVLARVRPGRRGLGNRPGRLPLRGTRRRIVWSARIRVLARRACAVLIDGLCRSGVRHFRRRLRLPGHRFGVSGSVSSGPVSSASGAASGRADDPANAAAGGGQAGSEVSGGCQPGPRPHIQAPGPADDVSPGPAFPGGAACSGDPGDSRKTGSSMAGQLSAPVSRLPADPSSSSTRSHRSSVRPATGDSCWGGTVPARSPGGGPPASSCQACGSSPPASAVDTALASTGRLLTPACGADQALCALAGRDSRRPNISDQCVTIPAARISAATAQTPMDTYTISRLLARTPATRRPIATAARRALALITYALRGLCGSCCQPRNAVELGDYRVG